MTEAERLAKELEEDFNLSYPSASMYEAAAELRRLHAINAELVEALKIGEQFINIASDWNIDEAEINGEMMSTYHWLDIVKEALEKAKQ